MEDAENVTEVVPGKQSHKEFLATLESLKVIQQYASFSEGEVMDDIYNLSLKMHGIGIL